MSFEGDRGWSFEFLDLRDIDMSETRFGLAGTIYRLQGSVGESLALLALLVGTGWDVLTRVKQQISIFSGKPIG